MQALRAFAGRMASGGAGMNPSVGGGASVPGGQGLGGAAKGLSVLGALMDFGLARQEAASLDQQRRDEGLAARSEFIQANERIAAIESEFNQMIANQIAAAPAMGIDSGSGSVIEAGRAARAEADREVGIVERSARVNASRRRLRAIQLGEAAKTARFAAGAKLGMDVVGAFMPRAG